MKKLNIFGMAIALAMGTTATAQQLPNGGFDSTWEDCVPWTSNGNTKTKGTQPQGWTISHVIGMGGTGATEVGSQIEGGYNSSTYAVKLINTANPLSASQIVPSYITLGTTWACSSGLFTIKNKDGGTFGGKAFTYKPDAISFYYQRSHGTAKPSEPATVVAYLWKGTWTQADVPGNNASSTSGFSKVTMTDRERNILGMTTDQGGTVTKSDDAELIASLNYSIEGDASDWTRFEQPFTYATSSTPEKINVIIAANDYFAGSDAIGKDNSLIVDNVTLIYYSRLSALTVNGLAVDGFDSNVYNYTMSGTTLPTEDQINATLMGQSATKTITIDSEAATVTITVSNVGADSDGHTSHSYVLQYEKAPAKVGVSTDYFGYLNGSMQEEEEWISFAENEEKTITITDYQDGTCDFLLPDLYLATLDLSLGDILVEGATVTTGDNGVTTYYGYVPEMQLLDGAIVAEVTLNGTITATDVVNMKIDVNWQGVPIKCTFTTNAQSGVDDVDVAPAENQTVDVYTITGVKVLENVYPADAVKILDKGFYIMGNKKVVVK